MAENQDGQEKTEEPSERRLREARERGQVPRSRELNSLLMLVVGSAAILALGDYLTQGMYSILREGFVLERAALFDKQTMILRLEDSTVDTLWLLAPLFLVLIVVAIASSLAIGGLNFSTQAFMPKFSKLDPIKGLQRNFGTKGLVELIKAVLKTLLVGVVAATVLYYNLDKIVALGSQPIEVAMADVSSQMAWFFLIVSASLVLVAAIDAPFQMWDNRRQLRMTKDEVKREHKEQEGSPEVKQRIRRAQMEMAQKRMMEKVPKADVVITNPTHFAVALKYDPQKRGAPVVVAKGADLVAQKIREIAFAHRVPVMSSPALARAIYYSTKLDAEIPRGLYTAVAKILAYVFQLKRKSGTDFSKALEIEDVEIPDEFKRS